MAILSVSNSSSFLFLLFVSVHFASGEGTRTWEQSKFEDLSKGTATGVAIRSTGGLELAPAFKAISTTAVHLHLVDRGRLERESLRRYRRARPRVPHHAAGPILHHL